MGCGEAGALLSHTDLAGGPVQPRQLRRYHGDDRNQRGHRRHAASTATTWAWPTSPITTIGSRRCRQPRSR